jgi:hypothetical protein
MSPPEDFAGSIALVNNGGAMKYRLLLVVALAAAAGSIGTARATLHITFAADSPESRVALETLNPALPADWTPYEFLVVEFKASSSQRFDLGIDTAQAKISKRIAPFAGVWVRAAIPLRFYRQPPGSAIDLAATYNQPRGSYWINISGSHGPTTDVKALVFRMDRPVGKPTLDVRSVTLAKADPGDAVLEGKPLVDEFGQYVHASWPGKVRTLDELREAWRREEEAIKAPLADRCEYGGFAGTRARATGFFRVEQIDGRWWFVDPDGHLFFSAGVNGVGTASGTRTKGREDLFAALPPPDVPGAGSFHTWNLHRRHGSAWRPAWARTAAKRLAAWGFNSIHYWGPRNPDPTAEPRVPYAQMLRGWQTGQSIMGMPDVYSEDFAARVEESARTQLGPGKDDPWMLGYFIGNEPPWPGRESQLVDLILAGGDGPMRARLTAHLAEGDAPARRKAFVHAAFERYLEVINAAVRKHAPNHLNLGIRFGGNPEDEVVRIASGSDVFSINIYRYAPPRATLDRVHALTSRPVLIGEFHIGVVDRGLSPGLVQAADRDERAAAYRYYVEQSAAHPAMVGTHWFQWLDQPVTGRNDGENYSIGLIDVTDQPHGELVAAATATHLRLLDVHRGTTPPFDRAPRSH